MEGTVIDYFIANLHSFLKVLFQVAICPAERYFPGAFTANTMAYS